MTDETQPAGSSNEETPVETPSQEAEQAVEAATESVDELKSRIKELESRRTQEGRSSAAIKKEKEALAAQLAEREEILSNKEAELEKWNTWYISKYGTPAQKAALAEKQSKPKDTGNQGKAEADTWRAIAEEENPQVKKVLLRAAKSGEFYTKKQIAALRESFGEEEEEGETQNPPKVKPVRTTGATEETLEQKLEKAKKAKNASEVLRISSQLAARRQAKRD